MTKAYDEYELYTLKKFDYYCCGKLFYSVPELLFQSRKHADDITTILKDEDGAHILYEDVFCPFVLELINKPDPTEKDLEIIDRSFKLIEELANDEDFKVRCVAEVSFIEPLLNYIKPTKRIEEYLLPTSLQMAREMGERWFGFDPNTWEKRPRSQEGE